MLNPHSQQEKVLASRARFKIVRAGRRSGKTSLEIEDMAYEAVSERDAPIFYIAPTQTQARAIIWEALKRRFAGIGQANEQRLEMKVPTKGGGTNLIKVAGWENRENFRGQKAKKIYFDEVDTMKNFFIGWQEIFRPALTDLAGDAMFAGTPQKENPNLRRLEKMAETDPDYEAFHFKTSDNPYIPAEEIEKARKELDYNIFQQEYEAEYLDNAGSLFHYNSLLDIFSNSIVKRDDDKYLIVDIADDGSDKTVFSFWESLEEYKREEFAHLNTEGIVTKIREFTQSDRIPYSHVAVDAIGVGAGVASSSLLDGIIGYKSSYQAIKTDTNIVRLPNVGRLNAPAIIPLVSDYRNLRNQCLFTLADRVNNHKVASRLQGRQKEAIIEELFCYQSLSPIEGKRQATAKEDVAQMIGHSPDASDCYIMRMYFEVMGSMLPEQSESRSRVVLTQQERMARNRANAGSNSNK